jgi:hypothetical protein
VLIDYETFDEDHPPPSAGSWGEHVIRGTSFDAVSLEGLNFEGIMERCAFTSGDFYWGLFNTALIANTRFEACRFPGTSFRGCTLVDCEFVDCRFELDNLGGDCTIDDCLIAACRFVGCTWTKKPGAARRDITRTRWLGCTQQRCTGFEEMF